MSRAAAAASAVRRPRRHPSAPTVVGGTLSVVATIVYSTATSGGGRPQAPLINLNGATISTDIWQELNITSGDSARISRVDWYKKTGTGAWLLHRADDKVAPYNIKTGTAPLTIVWHSGGDGSHGHKAVVVFDDNTTQEITATFTVTGNTPAPVDPTPTQPIYTELGTTAKITDYVAKGGDQWLVVPGTLTNPRTYKAGVVTTKHAPSTGPYSGWLVLQAEERGGVIIDLSTTKLDLNGVTRVLFIGFKFINGVVSLNSAADRIAFWYCDFSYPINVWYSKYVAHGKWDTDSLYTQTDSPHKNCGHPSGYVHAPTPHHQDARGALTAGIPGGDLPTPLRFAGSSTNVLLYGCDVHDCGDDGTQTNTTDDIWFVGHRVWNVTSFASDGIDYDPGKTYGQNDWFHNDGIQASGWTDRLHVHDSWIGQKMHYSAEGKTNTALDVQRTWFAGSHTYGLYCALGTEATGKLLSNTTNATRSFANSGKTFRADVHGGGTYAFWPDTYHVAGKFEVISTNHDSTTPAGVTVDAAGKLTDVTQVLNHAENPANIWRATNTYTKWYPTLVAAGIFTATNTFTGTYFNDMLRVADNGTGTTKEIIVPNGTYQIGALTSLLATDIVHAGKLRLVAQSMHGVKIVRAAQTGTTAENHARTHAILTNVTNVEFVGFHFEDILVYLSGCTNVKFWYCKGEYDPATHPAGANQVVSPYGPSGKTATAFILTSNGATRCSGIEFYGVDVPIVGDDVLRVTSSNNVKVFGMDLRGTVDASKNVGSDATLLGGSKYHDDAFQSQGSCQSFEMTNCTLARAVILIEQDQRFFTGTFTNVWFKESASFGLHLGVKTVAHVDATINITRTNCWSTGHTYEGGSPAALYPTGIIVATANNDTSGFRGTDTPASAGVTITQTGLLTTAPATDPVTTWRNANPYSSWASVLGAAT